MSRRGMTLVEMLVAMAATLFLMGAVAQVFSAFGSAVSDSRAVMETDSRMRAVALRLRSDLSGATAPTLPPLRPDQNAGYFEIIEGPNSDTRTYYDPASGGNVLPAFVKTGTTAGPSETSDDRIAGDTDDALLFTTRSTNPPFLGRFQSGKLESSIAEVAWFLRPTRSGTALATSSPVTYTLYRRQLLVMGYVGVEPFASGRNMLSSTASTLSGTDTTPWRRFMKWCDISARAAASPGGITFMPNTLADLTRRESRFMHNVTGITNGTGFPYAFPSTDAVLGAEDQRVPDGLTFANTSREGEDVVLTNVIAFDVRVFDPTAAVRLAGSGSSRIVSVPGDPGFAGAAGAAQGAYVDLGNGDTSLGQSSLQPRYGDFGDPYSGLTFAPAGPENPRTWDTWSTHYETDGVDQDASEPTNTGIDQGANGFDDDADGVIDNGPVDLDLDGAITRPSEGGEHETSPPYPYPLRGIEVRLRCYERSSRQVRQITIRHTFVPH